MANLWLGDLDNHVCYEFGELLGRKSECLSSFRLGQCFGLLLRHMTFGCLTTCCLNDCFVRMILSADQSFLFGSTGFSRVAETLAVVALHDPSISN